MENYPDITALFGPVFALAVIVEYTAIRLNYARGKYELRDAFASMSMGVGNLIVGALTAFALTWLMMSLWPYRIMTISSNAYSFILVFIAYDFVYYWKHRLAHRVRWFWMEHVTHHSSQHYNLSTALRQPWFGPFTGLVALGLPLVILGFNPGLIILVAGINLIYQFWIHTESIDRMPAWFEAIFNTPSHHRVHHAINPRYLDANYAGVFIVWDKMFGTFVAERQDEPPVYGIVKPLESFNLLVIAFHEAVSLISDCINDGVKPVNWLRRMINPPGWDPAGKHQRTEDIKRDWAERRKT